MNILRQHHISFKNALHGLFWAFTTQPNFRIHFILSFLALISSYVLGLNTLEWIIIILVIVIGLSAEMINTSIESMTDLITSEWHKEAKIAKDVSAGMMLLTAFGAVFIASLIFIPKIINFFPK